MGDSFDAQTKFDQGQTKIELDVLYRMAYLVFPKYPPQGGEILKYCQKNQKKPENFDKSSDDSPETQTKFDQTCFLIELDELYRMAYFVFPTDPPLGVKTLKNPQKPRKIHVNPRTIRLTVRPSQTKHVFGQSSTSTIDLTSRSSILSPPLMRNMAFYVFGTIFEDKIKSIGPFFSTNHKRAT